MSFAIANVLATRIFRTQGQVAFALVPETFTLIYKSSTNLRLRRFGRSSISAALDFGGNRKAQSNQLKFLARRRGTSRGHPVIELVEAILFPL